MVFIICKNCQTFAESANDDFCCSECGTEYWKRIENKDNKKVVSSCATCGEDVIHWSWYTQAVYCSYECAGLKTKSHKSQEVENYNVWGVYERHKREKYISINRCRQCQKEIPDGEDYCDNKCKKMFEYVEKYKDSDGNPIKRTTGRTCCKVLQSHAEILKDDPERLSTAFIKKMSKCDCKEV